MGPGYDISRHRFSVRSMAVNLGLVLGIAVAVFMWVRIANLLSADAPTAAPLAQPVSIVWGDHVFSSRAALVTWLRANHINVTTWLRQHPDAERIIDGRPVQTAPKSERTTVPAAAPKKRAAVASPAVEVQSGSGSKLGSVGIDLLVALAFLLGAFAFGPRSAWLLVARRLPAIEQRIYAAAGAVGILFGLLVGGIFP
jgi:hypothetical protein